MTDPVYLDYNATTPMDPRVLEAMLPWFLRPSNSGSRTHSYGQQAKDAVENARQQVADLLNAQPEEVYFTSGATESNNLAILGLAEYGERTGRRHIVSTAIEHKAVLEPLARLAQLGFEIDLAPVTTGGYVEPETIQRLLRPDTLLVSVMHANNETGVIQPLHKIRELLSDSETFLHTDAAQTYGKDVEALRSLYADMVSVSGHKVYGPQGVGALLVRRNREVKRLLKSRVFGGGQERGLRSGTVPVSLVVGLGKASELAAVEWRVRAKCAAELKESLVNRLLTMDAMVNGDQSNCQPYVINFSLSGVDSEAFMMATRERIAVSNGSACTSTLYSPSHVLMAMGLDEDRIESAIRMSWGPGVHEIPVDAIVDSVRALRG